MRLLILFSLIVLNCCPAAALEVAGVPIEPTVTVNSHPLKLHGSGIRKKFFVKVYIGSLYSAKHFASGAEAIRDGGDKLIRMNFLHSRVEKEKITEAFSEGIANNSPDLSGTAEVKKFLSLFIADFVRGDVVDLAIGADGTVLARHNGKPLGSIVSPRLAAGILAIYLGDKPADESLKKGMLGKE